MNQVQGRNPGHIMGYESALLLAVLAASLWTSILVTGGIKLEKIRSELARLPECTQEQNAALYEFKKSGQGKIKGLVGGAVLPPGSELHCRVTEDTRTAVREGREAWKEAKKEAKRAAKRARREGRVQT